MIQLLFLIAALFAFALFMLFLSGVFAVRRSFRKGHLIQGEAVVVNKSHYVRPCFRGATDIYELMLRGETKDGDLVNETWEVDKQIFDITEENQEAFVKPSGDLMVRIDEHS